MQNSTLICNYTYNLSINNSHRPNIGLFSIDVKTSLLFGQSVIVNHRKIPSKIHYRDEQGYVLVPDKEFCGYLIYLPIQYKDILSSNYAVIHIEVELSLYNDMTE